METSYDDILDTIRTMKSCRVEDMYFIIRQSFAKEGNISI